MKGIDAIENVLEDLRWAEMTIDEKLDFGMPENQAIKFRERRIKGVLLTAIHELEGIIKGENK